jgi:tyrosine-protein kinase Etk/Wzc
MESTEDVFGSEQEENIDILSYLFKYLRYWYWIVLSLALSLIGAYIYLKQYTPIYQVNATLLIKDEKKMNSEVLEKLDMNSRSKLVENEIEVLKSRALIRKVVEDLNLIVSYWTEGKARDRELHTDSPIIVNTTEIADFAYDNPLYIKIEPNNKYQLLDNENNDLGTFIYSQLVATKYGKFRVFDRDSLNPKYSEPIKVVFKNRDDLVNELINGLQIALLNPQSTLISLGLETAVPNKGKDILMNLLNEYTFTSLEDKNREATNTLRFIEERLKLVTAELGDVEQNVEQYRRAKGVTDLSSEANLFLGKVEENDSKLNELEIQLKVLDGIERYLNSSQVGIVAPATMMGVNDPVLTSYIDQLSQLEIERSKLAQTVQPGNPYLETINSQMRNVKQAIKENLNNQKTNLSVSKRSLVDLNSRLGNAISTIPRKEREFVGIKRQANIKEDLYLLLLRTREETALSYASTVTDSRLVDMPYSTGGAIRPNKKNIYSIGLLLGLLAPIAFISIKEMLTNTVQSKKEIERKTKIEVFGEIGLAPKGEKGEIIDIQSRTFVSEQIRMLRSNMQYLFMNSRKGIGRTIVITSSMSGEGKSFITLNLAASLAFMDKKIIILGLDLRKPRIQEYLKISNKVGISTYLIGKLETIDEIVQSTTIRNLHLIPSGPTPPNPSELISNGRLKDLIELLRHYYDYILIDTPPVGLVTDATILAPYTDTCLYLVRHEKTPKIYLNTINDLIKKKIFKSLHVIFNGVNYKNSSEYGYGYNHGYGREYYAEQPDKKNWLNRLLEKK